LRRESDLSFHTVSIIALLFEKPKGPWFPRGPWVLLKEGEAYAFTFLAILATVLAKVVI
jgi:hypothetical protein